MCYLRMLQNCRRGERIKKLWQKSVLNIFRAFLEKKLINNKNESGVANVHNWGRFERCPLSAVRLNDKQRHATLCFSETQNLGNTQWP